MCVINKKQKKAIKDQGNFLQKLFSNRLPTLLYILRYDVLASLTNRTQFSTYKMKLQNKQYHFKAPQGESIDVWVNVNFTIHDFFRLHPRWNPAVHEILRKVNNLCLALRKVFLYCLFWEQPVCICPKLNQNLTYLLNN